MYEVIDMLNVTEKNFREEVLNAGGVVLVDFWAPWCGPCRMLGPILEEVAQELADKVKVVKVNVDENPGLASQFNVMSIPTLIVFKQGQDVEKSVGALPKAAIKQKLTKWLN
ncbi:MAG TPA: thioredoxin [Bacillota bacterium]|nr:thioredoxin [Bacillota bacterium]